MTSAEKIVYDTTDAEASAPLNEKVQVLNPPESKESRCTPTKYKLFTVEPWQLHLQLEVWVTTLVQ